MVTPENRKPLFTPETAQLLKETLKKQIKSKPPVEFPLKK